MEATTTLHGFRSWADIHNDLSKDVPQRLIKTRKQAGQTLSYIEWTTAVKLLDFYAPGWSGEVTHIVQSEGMIVISYRITIPTSDGPVSRSATGAEFTTHVDKSVYAENRAMYPTRFTSYGEPATIAEAQAFKRAAAKLGIGLHLYTD